MAIDLIVEKEAQKEIENAIEWYENKQLGLGFEFYNYIDGYFKTLKLGNVKFPVKRKKIYRELPLKRLSFVIIYEHTESTIYIYSVFNTHQNPRKKYKY